jgi:hypothetical protein
MVASMTYEAERLVACPFCGGKAYLANPEPNALWRVICTKTCSAGEFVSNRTAAIAAWNTRADAGHAAGRAGAISEIVAWMNKGEGRSVAERHFLRKAADVIEGMGG